MYNSGSRLPLQGVLYLMANGQYCSQQSASGKMVSYLTVNLKLTEGRHCRG